jgi:P27 family predicted phage terminase small subunit
MGKRGPRPTPTAIKIARGTVRSRPKTEPAPPATGIVMPGHLGEVAQAKWRELLPLLQAVKVMTDADVEALARYCDTYEWWLATRAKLRKEGDTYPILNDGGEIKYIAQRPEVSIAHKLATQLRQLEQDFGLNPSARTSLHVEKPKAQGDDEADAILFG